jgi:hypothetical protein
VECCRVAGEDSGRLFIYGFPKSDFIKNNFEVYTKFIILVYKKYSSDFKRIMEVIENVLPEVRNGEELGILWSYLKDFSIIDRNIFIEFKQLPIQERKILLKNHIKNYTSMIYGITPSTDKKYVYHAIGSSNLNYDKMQQTLDNYSEKILKLPKSIFSRFTIKVNEVGEYNLAGTIKKDVLLFYDNLINEINNQNELELDENTLINLFTRKEKLNKTILGVAWPKELFWRYIIYKNFKLLGEETKENLLKKFNISNSYSVKEKIGHLVEFLNDTVKDNNPKFGSKIHNSFMQIHEAQSRLHQLKKEDNKIVSKKGNKEITLYCFPSRQPLDLFYGYYGENCTSSAPQEILNTSFTPVRIVQNRKIVGCIHFYHIEYNNKKILGVLGLEPRSILVNHIDNEQFFKNCNLAIIKQAKMHGYDAVGYPTNSTMHSNRGKIGELISMYIRSKKGTKDELPVNIEFPKEHNGYKTKSICLIWKR